MSQQHGQENNQMLDRQNSYYEESTVVALSTPVGTGGIAVIRMSGPQAIAIAEDCFRSPFGKKLSKAPSHTAVYGYIVEGEEKIDEVLALVMRGPRTFTGENTVEINCHGGMYICKRIIDVLLCCGAQMAQPGEFSKRAFLNGRLDLSQAEAVMDMIGAQTAHSLRAAVNQLGGTMSNKMEQLRSILIDTIVNMEVNIDYPEYEDLPEITDEQIIENCSKVREEVEMLLSTAESGRMLRQGVKISIIGLPNVGKSSLLNMLLREQRAIVTDIAGTTRDVLEEMLDLDGIPVRIMDTAGIHETKDVVEKIGVERALAAAQESDLVLLVLDASRQVCPEEIELARQVQGKPVLLVINKTDCRQVGRAEVKEAFSSIWSGAALEAGMVEVSAKQEMGMQALADKVKELFFAGDVLLSDRPLVTNMRQKQALMQAREALDMVLMGEGLEQDLLLIDIRRACDFLGEVSGRSTQEDVVSEIFSRFCLGK